MRRTSAPPLATTRRRFADRRRVALLSMYSMQHISFRQVIAVSWPAHAERLAIAVCRRCAGRRRSNEALALRRRVRSGRRAIEDGAAATGAWSRSPIGRGGRSIARGARRCSTLRAARARGWSCAIACSTRRSRCRCRRARWPSSAAWPAPAIAGRVRVDELTIDAVDPRTRRDAHPLRDHRLRGAPGGARRRRDHRLPGAAGRRLAARRSTGASGRERVDPARRCRRTRTTSASTAARSSLRNRDDVRPRSRRSSASIWPAAIAHRAWRRGEAPRARGRARRRRRRRAGAAARSARRTRCRRRATRNCGVEAAPGANPSTADWQPIFQLVAGGPAAWGAPGPTVADIGQGCGKPEPLHDVPPIFPCELLNAIAMQESGWRQFCVPDTPADQVGGASRTIISFDCGYGVGQVTSGMHKGETPAFDRARVADDATYNLATGTLILADKWRATNCVGDNQPRTVEDWYVADLGLQRAGVRQQPEQPQLLVDARHVRSERRLHGALSGEDLRLDGAPAVGGALDAAGRRLSRSRRPAGDRRDGAGPARADCASPTDCSTSTDRRTPPSVWARAASTEWRQRRRHGAERGPDRAARAAAAATSAGAPD